MENENKEVPYAAYEGLQVRHERTVKRLIIAIIITAILMFASNMAWLYAWQSYDYVSEETESINVDGKDGVANYIGNDGDIHNGENNSSKDTAQGTP